MWPLGPLAPSNRASFNHMRDLDPSSLSFGLTRLSALSNPFTPSVNHMRDLHPCNSSLAVGFGLIRVSALTNPSCVCALSCVWLSADCLMLLPYFSFIIDQFLLFTSVSTTTWPSTKSCLAQGSEFHPQVPLSRCVKSSVYNHRTHYLASHPHNVRLRP
jgi:hypothetical protein